MKTNRTILMFLAALMLSSALSAQSVSDLKKQQDDLQKQIQKTDKQLSDTKKNEKATQKQLNLLNKDIQQRKKLISSINSEITLLDNNIQDLTNQRHHLQSELEQLKDDYARMICLTHYADMQASPLLFLLRSDSFRQLMRRIRYLSEFQQYRKQQVRKIEGKQQEIDVQNDLLSQKIQDRNVALEAQKKEHASLAKSERKQQQVLKDLKKQEKELADQLKRHQKKADELARKIDELVRKQAAAQQQLTREQQLIAGGFEQNKGRLPWPVEKGTISGTFGTHQHPQYEHVTINNKGIYLLTQPGASARCVYEGQVSACLVMGNTYAVIVQHGNYRTVYSNLTKIVVKEGDKLQPKQTIGTILTDADNGNKTELFFQIYQDRNLLNPESWLAH